MKKIKLPVILLIYLICLPILDISSFLLRNNLNISITPSAVIRTIVPIALIIVIFVKNKFKDKIIFIGVIYVVYSIFHLIMFNKFHTELSYGTFKSELQYIFNYSFLIINLVIYIIFFYNKEIYKNQINKAVLISNGIYILSIYISIITKTTSTTYLEGIGYKGWFESGNAISSILILNLFFVFTLISKKEKKWIRYIAIIEIILEGIFLIFLLGTRTGLLGFILVTIMFIFSKMFESIKNRIINKQINNKDKILFAIIIITIIAIIGVLIGNIDTILERRKYLNSLNNGIIDGKTGRASNVTGDILKFKEQIDDGTIDEEYMPKAVQNSILELYNYATNNNINLTDKRTQELVYNYYLIKNQANICGILFGNGFMNNYAELVLEMEIPAFLFNFGIIGFILYFGPLFLLFIYYCYIGIKYIKNIDSEFVFLLSGILLSFVLSFLLGLVFFNSTIMIIVSALNVIMVNKCIKLKEKQIIYLQEEQIIEYIN